MGAFRRHTLLPLDDCLYALQPSIPHLTRSSLHRCLQRHGISRLPDVTGDKPDNKKFKTYPIGYFRIDIAELRTAAGNVLDGSVIGQNMQRHRHQEFIRFLNAIERQTPSGKIIHLILDNYAAHKHPKVRAWLQRHPRFVFHFTPTSCSWLNAVEGFFAVLAKRRLKRGVFHSVVDLQAAINRFIDERNQKPKPFLWTADPDKVIDAVKRGYQALDSIH